MSQPKLHPILFSTPMVQAILNGNKTQTRRVVKCYPTSEAHHMRQTAEWQFENKTCPYGVVGDILWVREKFNYLHDAKDKTKVTTVYAAGAENIIHPEDLPGMKWKPSIHMPFTACRIFLKIKSVRVERLQSITEADAKAEGVEWTARQGYKNYLSNDETDVFKYAQRSFITLWQSINGAASYDANPWVWVIEFEKTEKP